MRVFIKKHKIWFFLCFIGILFLATLISFSVMFVSVATIDKEYTTLYYHGNTYTRISTNYAVDSNTCIGKVDNGTSLLDRLLFPLELFTVKNDEDKRFLIIHGKDPYFEGIYCLQDESQTVERELQDENLDAEYVGELNNKTVPIDTWAGKQLESIRNQANDMPSTVVVFNNEKEEDKMEYITIKKYVLNRCFYHFLSGSIRKYDNIFYYIKNSSYTFPPKQWTYDWFPLSEELQSYLSNIFN